MFLDEIIQSVHYWLVVITTPLGILLNLASILVYTRPNLNKTSMGFCFTNLSVWNCLVLFYFLFVQESDLIMGFNLTTPSDFTCQFNLFLRRLLRQISTWVEALITIDRYLAIRHPNKFNISKTRFMLLTVVIVFLLALLGTTNLFYRSV